MERAYVILPEGDKAAKEKIGLMAGASTLRPCLTRWA